MPIKRLFIAAPVDPQVKTRMSFLASAQRERLAFRKWVHGDDYHVTLQFLGDTDETKEAEVRRLLQRAASAAEPFRLAAEGFGAFGPPAAPSVLWLGVKGELAALRQLHAAVEAAMAQAGFARETKPFRPHLTLARKYAGTAPFVMPRSAPAAAAAEEQLVWTVGAIVLYESHLARAPMYEAVGTFPLG